MHELEQHEMVLEKIHPSGGEEWYCPSCGRCLLVTWKPRFMKIVREAGDEFALHTGSKSGLQMRPVQVMSEDDTNLEEELDTLTEDARLAPYVAWLEEVGFESLWND
jgi:hypothetical protein